MRRALTTTVAALAALLTAVTVARADHDPGAPFAGAWDVGAGGGQGRLALVRLGDAEGRALLASLGGALACPEPTDFYGGRLAAAGDHGPVAGCTRGRGDVVRLHGVYSDEALAPAPAPAALAVVIRRSGEAARAILRWTSPSAGGVARQAPLVFRTHLAGDGAAPELTLQGLRVTAAHAAAGATATISGTFRGAVVAGRSRYRLRPAGGALATYRPTAAPVQRARVDEVVIDADSGAGRLAIAGTGSLIGGPVAAAGGGVCRAIAFRFTVPAARGAAALRWACRSRAGRAAPVLVDVFRRPGDRITSRYALVRRPCSPTPGRPIVAMAVPANACRTDAGAGSR